ncbi:dihydroneopterin aldolase [Nocardioidaceae bacterium]|nr:dihydroneopterin aldolase [Nocardioidaceae bacterium]
MRDPQTDLDELTVRGIEVFAHHGVLESERREGQTFRVDLTLGLGTSLAAQTDRLEDTVDYGALVGEVVAAVERDPVDLIETVAQRVAEVCLTDPRVQRVVVSLHKPHAPIDATFDDVVLTITRSRSD